MGSAATLKVLILEDQPLIAMDIEDTLLANGFEIAAVLSSRVSALEWLETGKPDVVLLDIELRDGMCVDVARRLVEQNFPFVVTSGSFSSSPDIDPVFQRGEWIGKPNSESDLVAALRAVACMRGRTLKECVRD